jgi:hypothetical protein
LTKVYLPALVGYVPAEMTQVIASFMEFCYLVHCSQIDEDTLKSINLAIKQFHTKCEIFHQVGVQDDFNLP